MKIKKSTKQEAEKLRQKIIPIFDDLGVIAYDKLKEIELPIEGLGFRVDIISSGKYSSYHSCLAGSEQFLNTMENRIRPKIKDVIIGLIGVVKRYRRIVIVKIRHLSAFLRQKMGIGS